MIQCERSLETALAPILSLLYLGKLNHSPRQNVRPPLFFSMPVGVELKLFGSVLLALSTRTHKDNELAGTQFVFDCSHVCSAQWWLGHMHSSGELNTRKRAAKLVSSLALVSSVRLVWVRLQNLFAIFKQRLSCVWCSSRLTASCRPHNLSLSSAAGATATAAQAVRQSLRRPSRFKFAFTEHLQQLEKHSNK